jgi:hypothetical protein
VRITAQFSGLDRASRQLSDELKRVGEEGSEKFVTLSLKMIEAATAPYVPVATSELINSAFSRVRPYMNSTSMGGFIGEFGYGANYAGFVHEGGPKNWQKAGASDRFLELGVQDFIDESLDSLLSAFGGS